jgi:hypothetical protein
MAMTVAVTMFVAFLIVPVALFVLIVTIGVSVTTIVILMTPVTFVELPAFGVPHIVGVYPISAGIRDSLVVSRNPPVVPALRHPESLHPGKLRRGRGWRRCFIAHWRRCDPDINRHLRMCGSTETQ